jgi:hypothetical protein
MSYNVVRQKRLTNTSVLLIRKRLTLYDKSVLIIHKRFTPYSISALRELSYVLLNLTEVSY